MLGLEKYIRQETDRGSSTIHGTGGRMNRQEGLQRDWKEHRGNVGITDGLEGLQKDGGGGPCRDWKEL